MLEPSFYGFLPPRRKFNSRNRFYRILKTSSWVLLGVASFFFVIYLLWGPGGDIRRLKVRILLDGAAPLFRFSPGSELKGKDFSELSLRGARFEECDLRGACFFHSKLRSAQFLRCDLRGADFRKAELLYADLSLSSLEGSDLAHADLRGANLRGCSLRYATLKGANLNGADLSRADLRQTLGLTPGQVLSALNWEKAKLDPELSVELKRSKSRQASRSLPNE